MKLYTHIANKKITSLTYFTLIALICIILKLLYLQINLTPYFVARSKQNFSRTETIHSPRGNIVDRNGKLLATNRPAINLYWQGTGNSHLTTAQCNILDTLQEILGKPINLDQSLAKKILNTERQYRDTQITSDITLEQLSKIEELFPNHPNIVIKTTFQRLYPYKECASHIIGYLGGSIDIESSGKMGIEKMLEELLKGQNGVLLNTINSVGRKLAHKKIKTSLIGQNIATTIDIQLQQICENVFPDLYNGAFIVMNPKNGNILSLVSRPNFDPNIFLQPISIQSWKNLQENQPFLNRALSASYPPGSIFKLATVSAALEHEIISPESEWNCNGFVFLGNRKNWCHKRQGHGILSTAQAVAQSCNILCYEIGKQIDINTLAHYAHIFGLGQKTNISFPESSGFVPTKEWKMNEKGERWWPGETLSATIGQSFLLTTPIQIACMIASIFTGELPTPRILAIEKIQSSPLDIKPETLTFLKKSMKLVVTKGTGKRVSKIKDFEIYAKTSTAQTSGFSKRKMGTQYMEHGWFVAHIKYKDTDPLIAVILIENAGSSRMATDVAKNFLIQYASLIDKK